jgi:hypothetical protein
VASSVFPNRSWGETAAFRGNAWRITLVTYRYKEHVNE